MVNFASMVSASHSSALFYFFIARLSDALLIVLDGEYDRLVAHLDALGMTSDEISRVSRSYVRSMVRKYSPEPRKIVHRLLDLYLFFDGMDDPDRPGQPYLAANSWEIFVKEIVYVQVPCL
jgi:hypothetical protein